MSTPSDPPRRVRPRRRRRRHLIIAGIVLAAVVVAGLLAFRPVDDAVRGYLADQIEVSLRTSLAIASDTSLDVAIGGGSILRQLVAGELARVDVSTESITFGQFSGPATLTARGIPVDTSRPVTELDIDFAIDQAQLLTVSSNLSGVPITDVVVDSSQINVSAELRALLVTVPLSVGLVPSAVEGQIAFAPTTIGVAGAQFTASDLRTRFGALAVSALTTQNLCIAEGLPAAFVLDRVNPEPGELRLHFSGDGAVLTDAGLATLGTCPAA